MSRLLLILVLLHSKVSQRLAHQFFDFYLNTDGDLVSSQCSNYLYQGSEEKTVSGYDCLDWSNFRSKPFFFKKDPGSSCRNPDNDLNGPWCFISKTPLKTDYCQVPGNCPHPWGRPLPCKRSKNGMEYVGERKHSQSRTSCQYWGSSMSQFDPTIHKQKNYCRNPDNNSIGPWCISGLSAESCEISWCRDYEIKVTAEVSATMVRGSSNNSEGALKTHLCQQWTPPASNSHWITVSFAKPTKLIAFKFKSGLPQSSSNANIGDYGPTKYKLLGSSDPHLKIFSLLHSVTNGPRFTTSNPQRHMGISSPDYFRHYKLEINGVGHHNQKPFPVILSNIEFTEHVEPSPTQESVDELCGRRVYSQSVFNVGQSRRRRVVDGINSFKGSLPWQVALVDSGNRGNRGNRGNFRVFCGGSIIDHRHILTAAHCVKFREFDKVHTKIMAGKFDFGMLEQSTQTLDVSTVFANPNYNSRTGAHNIAIIRLKQHIEFNSYALPICLPPSDAFYDYIEQDEVLFSGWGSVDNHGRMPDKLQVAKLRIHDQNDCKKKWMAYYDRLRWPTYNRQYLLTDDEFCANTDRVESCSGDSGGAAVKELKGRYFALGISTYGPKPCQDVHAPPSVYTKTSKYVEWIKETLSQKDTNEEFTSSLHCKKDEFACQNGQCIAASKVCDGEPNCKTGLDETNCDHRCGVKVMSAKNQEPWMARIWSWDRRRWESTDCSATIVGPFHAVTYKQCLWHSNLDQLQLRVGHSKSRTNGNYGNPQYKNYASNLPKDAYAIDSFHEIGEVILIQVGTEIIFSSEVRPICISEVEDLDGELYTAGWRPHQMNSEVRVNRVSNITENMTCEIQEWLQEGAICGLEEYNGQVCNGFHGGAVIKTQDGINFLVGVINHRCFTQDEFFSFFPIHPIYNEILEKLSPTQYATYARGCPEPLVKADTGFCVQGD